MRIRTTRRNLKHPGLVSLVLERKNWLGKPILNYETQIMNDTEYKSYSEMNKLAHEETSSKPTN